jgi:FtsH-binding integral membrane protein
MRWLAKPPVLYRLNGIGMALYGKRDVDANDSSYVTTYVLTFVWIPLCCFAAYRVREASGPSGWSLIFWSHSSQSFFIGPRVPLSTFARRWNLASALLFAAIVGRAVLP